jgi:hypothetical protein
MKNIQNQSSSRTLTGYDLLESGQWRVFDLEHQKELVADNYDFAASSIGHLISTKDLNVIRMLLLCLPLTITIVALFKFEWVY